MALCFDTETDGFLEEATRLHVLVITDTETGECSIYNQQGTTPPVEEGIGRLQSASNFGNAIVAHNAINFDIPVLKKLYPGFSPDMNNVRDTLVMTRVIHSDLRQDDDHLIATGKLPPQLRGRHSLEAWGHRLGEYKDDYTGGFAAWTPEMESYCVQDVAVLVKLWQYCCKREDPQSKVITLEHEVARIIFRQVQHGFAFDAQAAHELHALLVKRKLELEEQIQATLKPMYLPQGHVLEPKRNNATLHYTAGGSLQKVVLTPFNPGSRDHIQWWLGKKYGWRPVEQTLCGKAKVDDTVLRSMPWPEAALLADYFTVAKRLGQLAEGPESWLQRVGPDGRLHGSVITNGAVTGRMTHQRPNMANVPAVHHPYGKECRALFIAPRGKVLVGADASALELRCLAHYMARYDHGEYIATVTKGKKEDGTEIHSVNRRALGITSRDDAKTWFYAFIYGAGNKKLGSVLLPPERSAEFAEAGGKSRAKFLRNLPALGTLLQNIKKVVAKRGYLIGLDGRRLPIRSDHAALNTLLQSAGAVIMKEALTILDHTLKNEGLTPGEDYEFVGNIHDEWQIECNAEWGEFIGGRAIEALEKAPLSFRFSCPITGEYRIGTNWAETH